MIQTRTYTTVAAFVTLFCALFIAGCKADSAVQRASDIDVKAARAEARARSASKPLTAAEQQALDDGRPVIACFGDSITAGLGVAPGESYPDDLQRLLDSNGYRYRVVNFGISGNTTKDGLDRIDSVLASSPTITVVEFGGNDGLRGLPIDTTRTNLDAMLDKLTSSRTQVVMAGITLPPQYGKDYVAQFNSTYTLAAAKHHVPLLPFIYKDVYGVPDYIQADQTHATALGNKQVAKNVFGLIQPYLKR